MELPKITIITPSYQQGKYLEKTIQSVVNQDYPKLEYLIFDGGSTDETVSILKKYDSQINYWVSEPDDGQSDAINKGLRQATGDILTWINSDDQLIPNTLHEIGYFFVQNPDTFLAHGKTILFGENYAETITGAPEKDLEILYLACLPFPQPSSFFRREVIEKFGFLNEDLHYGMDYDLFLQVALNQKITRLEGVYSKYLLHPQSKSMTDNSKFAHDYARIFSKLLRSLPNTGDLILKMRELGIYDAKNDDYIVTKNYTKNQIKKAFLYHLKYQLSFYYEDLNLEMCQRLTGFLKDFAPEFVAEFPQIKQIYWRSKLLNKYILRFLRGIKR